ncbi:hypothetical protein O3G_MSEX003916 [Manduca sexta]|uniref:Juvenile hormone acid O-methyltransferase n=1 Tax=Manduca sexta TaxID=7130 RepID=A0A921YVD8_MANSE|nr:hypothetical protein O3G_MSEX003916 [Manduca sexta]
MNNAELYRKSNSLQKRDAVECLEEYAKNIKWKKYADRVIDIGCADGSVTNILKSYMPINYKQLLGCDISEKMVKFANDHHGVGRTSFRVLNIEGELPDELRDSFDHAFSFYTLHWIRNQEKAFKNIFDILANGGDCLLLFMGHTPIFDVYRKLSRSNKWSSWLKDVDRYVSPYHDSRNPEKEVSKLMEKIGFTDIDVRCKNMVYVYDDINVLKKSVAAINPFDIPKDSLDDFMEDYIELVRELRLVDKANNIGKTITVRHNYTVIVASGRKLTQNS